MLPRLPPELGVLQPVCGLLRGCAKGWAPQNKRALSSAVFALCHTQGSEALKPFLWLQ